MRDRRETDLDHEDEDLFGDDLLNRELARLDALEPDVARPEATRRGRTRSRGSGGLGSLLLGLVLAIVGAYLILNQVYVTTGYWNWLGQHTFGLTLLPFIVGIAVLVYNGKSAIGWLLTGGGLVLIFAGLLANLTVFFRATTLYEVLVAFGLFAAGLALLARSLRNV